MTAGEYKKLFEYLEPVCGREFANNLYVAWLLSEEHGRQKVIERIQLLVNQRIGIIYKPTKSLPPPADKSRMFGDVKLADVHYPEGKFYAELKLKRQELMRHILISGMTGSGKTTLSMNLAKELNRNKVPFWVFDWKGTWRKIVGQPGFNDTLVCTIGSEKSPLKIDPFAPPPGVPLDRWIDVIIMVMQVSYFLAEGSEFILNEALYDLEPGEKLTFNALLDKVRHTAKRGREGLWNAPVKRALAKLVSARCLGRTLVSKPVHHLSSLVNHNVIFEFTDVIHMNDRIFMTCFILNYLNEYLRAQPKRNELLLGCFIEDAHNIYNKAIEDRLIQQNIMDVLLDEIREFGVCMAIITLQPSKVSSSCKANTYTKVTFNLGNGDDIQDISRCMFLDPVETKAIDLCDVGECIVKLKGRFFEPVHCKIDGLLE